ncbi:MAG TPA: universal stress protein [Thermoanaerobaculia bacterium]|jgi:nucleotide-binding universal stress UspA family protein
MFRRILVPVDFTKTSRRAVLTAARIAASRSAETTLLHVIERIDAGRPGELAAFYRRLERAAGAKLRDLAEILEKRRLPVKAEIRYGNRVTEILRFAEEWKTDLLVMSSHRLPVRRSGGSWGTISYKVGLLAHCPVLLIK